jgi:Txe/YoeB family toxin of Txe-Axe toxin-antitoxin module
MGAENVPSTLYVDASATDEQLIALERIYQSFKPLQPFVLLSVKRVPLALVSPDEKTYEVNVPGLLKIEIRRQLDAKGNPQMETAALDYFSNRLEYAHNLVYKVWNPEGDLRWDYSGRQANFRTIDLDSRDYREQRMLIQYADGSGYFTKKQLELIKSQKLPTLPSYPKPAK